MVTMRDGVRLQADIYRPKEVTGPVPVIFSRTPYNFNTGGKNWDAATGPVATNVVHHSARYPTKLTVTVVKKPPP